MNRLGKITVGEKCPVRVMGILNTSPESFYKKSVKTSEEQIRDAVLQMESDGADFVDVGGMSTAPYLSTLVSEDIESDRVLGAVKIIQSTSDIPISVDTCRASVAEAALEAGVDILNDISGLKYDKKMRDVISRFKPSVILCAYGTDMTTENHVSSARNLLNESISIAKECGILSHKMTLDPAIGFFRKSGMGEFFTKIRSDWTDRDIEVLSALQSIKQEYPVMVSVSGKSFLGKILGKDAPGDRLSGSIAAEAVAVLYGADIIRTHNVAHTRDAVLVASKLSGRV